MDFVNLIMDEKGFINTMFETGDRSALKIYVNFKMIMSRAFVTQYARIFGLCRLLGVTNIYDIGCGSQYQAYMLAYPEISYVGIDANDRIDFEEMNQAFSNGFGTRMKFFNAVYPCDITPPPNNTAVIKGITSAEETFKKDFASAVARDFERIITDFGVEYGGSYEEMFYFWRNALPGYKVCKLGCDNLIFATKIPRDIEILEEVDYSYQDDRFLIGTMELQELYAKYHIDK